MHLFLDYKDSKSIHHFNSTVYFITDISPPFIIKAGEKWECALTECDFGENLNKDLYVSTNIIDKSFARGEWTSCLRVVKESQIFSDPYYFPIDVHRIDSVEVYITTHDGKIFNTEPSKARVVLAIRKMLK